MVGMSSERFNISTYVINLKRRADRRRRFANTVPAGLDPVYTSDWDRVCDARDLERVGLDKIGVGLFPWQIESGNPWWNRPLRLGEVGCTLAHLAVWEHAAEASRTEYVLVLEDDVQLSRSFKSDLELLLASLENQDTPIDVLLLGRRPMATDRALIPGVVQPGYWFGAYAYVVKSTSLRILLGAGLAEAIIPVDEFLFAMQSEHPRADVARKYWSRLNLAAADPCLVAHRADMNADSDTENSSSAE